MEILVLKDNHADNKRYDIKAYETVKDSSSTLLPAKVETGVTFTADIILTKEEKKRLKKMFEQLLKSVPERHPRC